MVRRVGVDLYEAVAQVVDVLQRRKRVAYRALPRQCDFDDDDIEALRHLATEVGSDWIVRGTDYPFHWTSTSVDHMLTTPGLSDASQHRDAGRHRGLHCAIVRSRPVAIPRHP